MIELLKAQVTLAEQMMRAVTSPGERIVWFNFHKAVSEQLAQLQTPRRRPEDIPVRPPAR